MTLHKWVPLPRNLHTHTLFRIPPHHSLFSNCTGLLPHVITNWRWFYTSFQCECHLFLPLVWLKLPLQCWVEAPSRHSSLAPDVLGKISHLSALSMMLAGFLVGAFIRSWRSSLFIPSLLRAFILKECWIFFNAFSATIEITVWFFVLYSINMGYVWSEAAQSCRLLQPHGL